MTARAGGRWKNPSDPSALFSQASRDLRPGYVPDYTTRAKHESSCPDCGRKILIGQGIAMIRRGNKSWWRHATCALPCGPGKTADASSR